MRTGMIIGLLAIVILPHYLNKTFLYWHDLDGRLQQRVLPGGKWIMWSLDLLVYLTLPVLALWYYVRRGWFQWAAFDFKTAGWPRSVLIGLAMFAGIWGMSFFTEFIGVAGSEIFFHMFLTTNFLLPDMLVCSFGSF